MPRKTELRKCFEDFNHKFFGDRLFDIDVRWSKTDHAVGDSGENLCGYYLDPVNEYKQQEIVLAKVHKRSGWIWKMVLLHEMAHADLWLTDHIETWNHPPEFDARMLQLAEVGAFVGIW